MVSNQRPNPNFSGRQKAYLSGPLDLLSQLYIYSGHVPISIGW
jgi:hypothetical protein